MSDVPFIADALLNRLRGFVDNEIRILYVKMESLYAQGERDGTELSLVLSEICTLKRLVNKLESEARKSLKEHQGVKHV